MSDQAHAAVAAPPCRVCGSNKWVAIYWPDAPDKAVCVECCDSQDHDDGETGHQFSYDRHEGHTCDYCGINRNDTIYRYDEGSDE